MRMRKRDKLKHLIIKERLRYPIIKNSWWHLIWDNMRHPPRNDVEHDCEREGFDYFHYVCLCVYLLRFIKEYKDMKFDKKYNRMPWIVGICEIGTHKHCHSKKTWMDISNCVIWEGPQISKWTKEIRYEAHL